METRTTSEIEQSTGRLLQDLKQVVADGEDLLRAGAEDLSERGTALREQLATALDTARDTSHKLQRRVVQRARIADGYIQENVYQSLGIAFGAGLLLGVIAFRK